MSWGFKIAWHARFGYTYHIANILIEWWCGTACSAGPCLSEVETRAKLNILYFLHIFRLSLSDCRLQEEGLFQNEGSVNPGFQLQVQVLHTFPFSAGNWMNFKDSPTIYETVQHQGLDLQCHKREFDAWVLGVFYRSPNSLSFIILSKSWHFSFRD